MPVARDDEIGEALRIGVLLDEPERKAALAEFAPKDYFQALHRLRRCQ
jgi:hypothetical protein